MKRTASGPAGSNSMNAGDSRSNPPGHTADATHAYRASGANAAGAPGAGAAIAPGLVNVSPIPGMRSVDGNPYPAPGNPPGNGLPPVAHLAHAPGFAPDDSHNDAHVPSHPAPLPLAVAGMAAPSAASPNASSQKSLFERAVKAVKLGVNAWHKEWHSLKPEERTSFLTTGLQEVVKLGRPRLYQYKAVLHGSCCMVGRDALLAQSLLSASDLIPLLIGLDLNQVLADILATKAGRQALLEANKRDITPLHVAAVNNNRKAVRLLLLYAEDAGALRMRPDATGWLPLHYAAWVVAADAARHLLQDQGKEQRLSPTKGNNLPLHIAIAYAANAAMVRLLLEDCAKEQTTVQSEPWKGIALMLAAGYGLADIVKVLLDVKPTLAQQLTMRDSNGRSALDHAKLSGDAATIKLLEDALQSLPVASSSSVSTATTATTSTTSTASHAHAGSDALPAGSLSAFSQTILSERAVKAVKLGRPGWQAEWNSLKKEERTSFLTTSLQEIAKLGRPRLYQYKAALHGSCCMVGRDALLAQSLLSASDLIPLLIGLDLNQVLADILATEAGRQALLEANKQDITPLHVAAMHDNRKAVRLVLLYAEDAAALRMKPDARGWLPLHRAASVGAIDAARYLLQDQGKEQRLSPTKGNNLPLHIAIVYAANAAMVRLLLEDCAKEQTTVQSEPWKGIALMLAADYGLADIVKVLLDVKPTLAQQLTMRDSNGRSALDHAKLSGDAATIKLLEDALQSLPAASSSSASTATTSTASHAHAGGDAPVPLTPYPATPAPGMAGAEEATEEGEPDLFF